MTARDIVNIDGRMSARPEFFSGRGATTSDLNYQKLQTLWGNIKLHVGDAAAAQMVYMVADLPCLSATDFLLALYRMEQNGWKWHRRLRGRDNGLYVTDPVVALFSIGSALNNDRDETVFIRDQFLREHKAELPKSYFRRKKHHFSPINMGRGGSLYFDAYGDYRW